VEKQTSAATVGKRDRLNRDEWPACAGTTASKSVDFRTAFSSASRIFRAVFRDASGAQRFPERTVRRNIAHLRVEPHSIAVFYSRSQQHPDRSISAQQPLRVFFTEGFEADPFLEMQLNIQTPRRRGWHQSSRVDRNALPAAVGLVQFPCSTAVRRL